MATYKLVDEEKLDSSMTATANAIRAKTGSEDPIKWDMETGMAEAVEPVFEAGKSAGTDDFWDVIQDYGKRTNYIYGFIAWGAEYIRPKYKVIPNITNIGILNQTFAESTKLKKVEAEYFDFSKYVPREGYSTDGLYWTFSNDIALEEIEDIGIPIIFYFTRSFTRCLNLKKIAVLRVSEKSKYDNPFNICESLEELTIEGTIGQDGFDVSYSPLNKASILSILNALSTTTTGMTVTLSLTAVNTAFETSPGAADGSTSEEWTTLIATKSNWTISLA